MADASKVKRTAATKKPPNAGMGRKRGVPNKVTREVREVIAEFARAKAPEFEGWIDKVAKTDPARAAELYLRALEYHIPKLGRMEHTVGRKTLEELVTGADRLAAERTLEALPAAPGSYSVPLDRHLPDSPVAPARVPPAAPAPNAEAEPPVPPRASDQAPALPESSRQFLAAGERTVADLRAKAHQSLLPADYDPYQTY